MKNSWWSDGVRFECQGSGKCCVTHGSYGHVYLTLEDRRRLAKHFKMATSAFTRKHCRSKNGNYFIDDQKQTDCRFLEGKRCGVYEARPAQCRTWPFWPETMNAKTWKTEVATFCPGVGQGKLFSAQEIQTLLDSQETS